MQLIRAFRPSVLFILACVCVCPPAGATTVSVNVKDNQIVGDVLAIQAQAQSESGVLRVEFRIDDQLRATVMKPPYDYAWDTIDEPEGLHTLMVAAFDNAGRTALHVAAFGSHGEALRALAAGGGDIDALENDRYDVITIAAVAGDALLVKLAVELGGNPKRMTSRYDGTALIASSHRGHVDVVRALIDAGAALDHVNNLGWTALIEAVILGDGGARHVAIVKALVAAGADKTVADRNGVTPLRHAEQRGYREMVAILR